MLPDRTAFPPQQEAFRRSRKQRFRMISIFDKIRRKMICAGKMTAGRLLFIVPHSAPQDKMQFVFFCGDTPSAPFFLPPLLPLL